MNLHSSIFLNLDQWFLNLEVLNSTSFMQAFTNLLLKIPKISVNKLKPKANYASVAHKIILFKEAKPTKHEFHTKSELSKYSLQTNASYAVAF